MTEEQDNVIPLSKACPNCGKIFRLPRLSKRLKKSLKKLGLTQKYYDSIYCSTPCIYDNQTEEGLKARKDFYNKVTKEFFSDE